MLFLMIFSIINKEFTVEGKGEFVPGYQIQEGKIPTYLNYTFTNLPEEVFPADITIEMSLSRMPGTLLYSVDSNNNQMIVSITDGHTPSLDIEFSKEHVYVSLSKLCNLEYPRYIKLKLRIQMRELMYIQCNDGLMESAKYQRTGKLNKDYPIPKFVNKTDKLQAYLWLVNTPSDYGVHANSDQLSGCIFKVLYKKQQLNMGSKDTGDHCPITCTDNVCNSGQCLETYNSVPICNCTSSFFNGQYCNDSLHTGNYLMKEKFQYKAIKLAFNSSSDRILELNDKTVNMRLFSDNSRLKFIINCTNNAKITIESTITEKYQKKDMHLVIFEFKESKVEVQYYLDNSKWILIRIPHDHDLSRVLFESLRLEGDVTDLSYKNDVKELRWSKIDYDNNTDQEKKKLITSETKVTKYITTSSSYREKKKTKGIRDLNQTSGMEMAYIVDFDYLNSKVSSILALLVITMIGLILYCIIKIFYIMKFNYNVIKRRELKYAGIFRETINKTDSGTYSMV